MAKSTQRNLAPRRERKLATKIAAAAFLWIAAASPAAAELSAENLRELESLLSRLGFDPGPADGIVDEQTISAIRAYQTFAALPADGTADAALLAELRGVAEALSSDQQDSGQAAEASPPDQAAEPPPSDQTAETLPPDRAAESAPPDEIAEAIPPDDHTPPMPPPAKPSPPAREIVAELPAGTIAAVQLASTLDPDGPARHWSRLEEKLPGLLRGRSPQIATVDLGERGVFHRLTTGPFADRAAAEGFCGEMKRAGEDCRVVLRSVTATPPEAAEAETAESSDSASEEPPNPDPVALAVAVALAPGDGQAELAAAATAFRSGDCRTADARYTKALEKGGLTRGEAAKAFNNRGRCRFELALYEDAVADHGAAIELAPGFAAAYANRGRALAATGAHDQARDDLKRAQDLGFRTLGSGKGAAP